MEKIILLIIVIIIAIVVWLIACLIDDVKELKWYKKHYENMIRNYEEEKKKRSYINDIKKECNCWNSYTKNLNK